MPGPEINRDVPRRQLRLIVNADDFGMTAGVNRAVAELYDAGALTSATLMAQGAAFADAVSIAKERPGLGVGCHVVLVDGKPTAAARHARSIVARNGALTSSMLDFAVAVQSRFADLTAIEHETAAQIAKLQEAGVQVTHVDTHKHTHLLPRVARAVMLGARSRGITRIRNPFEPAWCARLSPAPLARRLPFRLLHRLERSFRHQLAQCGMTTTDGSLGLVATGSMNAPLLSRILQAAPAGSHEWVCHPGYNDADLAGITTKLRASREIERDALLAVLPHLPPEHFRFISFADLGESA